MNREHKDIARAIYEYNNSSRPTKAKQFSTDSDIEYSDKEVRLKAAANLGGVVFAGANNTKTITSSTNGPLTIDGVAASLNDLVLIDEVGVASKSAGGIYKVTAVGDGSNPWVLTRETGYTEEKHFHKGDVVKVTAGTANANKLFEIERDPNGKVDAGGEIVYAERSGGKPFTFYCEQEITLTVVNLDGTTYPKVCTQGYHPVLIQKITTGGSTTPGMNVEVFPENRYVEDI